MTREISNNIKENIKLSISNLIDTELTRASEMFGKFNSGHEGYAIIAEEVDELNDEIAYLNESKEKFWKRIKQNTYQEADLDRIIYYAENAVYEAIQVAAMAKRYKVDLLGNKT